MCVPCGHGRAGENHSLAQITGLAARLVQPALRVTARMFVPCPVESVVCLYFLITRIGV